MTEKNYHGWAVIGKGHSRVILDTVRHNRADSIAAFLEESRWDSWDYCRRRGWRCIKIKVLVAEGEPKEK